MWWAIGSMTTLSTRGLPTDTSATQILAVSLVAVGFVLVAVFAGAAAERFLRPEVEQAIEEERDEGVDVERVLAELRAVRA
jgi:phosphoribulokinase